VAYTSNPRTAPPVREACSEGEDPPSQRATPSRSYRGPAVYLYWSRIGIEASSTWPLAGVARLVTTSVFLPGSR